MRAIISKVLTGSIIAGAALVALVVGLMTPVGTSVACYPPSCLSLRCS